MSEWWRYLREWIGSWSVSPLSMQIWHRWTLLQLTRLRWACAFASKSESRRWNRRLVGRAHISPSTSCCGWWPWPWCPGSLRLLLKQPKSIESVTKIEEGKDGKSWLWRHTRPLTYLEWSDSLGSQCCRWLCYGRRHRQSGCRQQLANLDWPSGSHRKVVCMK